MPVAVGHRLPAVESEGSGGGPGGGPGEGQRGVGEMRGPLAGGGVGWCPPPLSPLTLPRPLRRRRRRCGGRSGGGRSCLARSPPTSRKRLSAAAELWVGAEVLRRVELPRVFSKTDTLGAVVVV